MIKVAESFDPQQVEWRQVTDPSCSDFKVDFEFSLLGYDMDSGRLDMLLRYGPGGHCRRHLLSGARGGDLVALLSRIK